MASALIKINGAIGSRSDFDIGASVTLSNNNNTGASTWLWELLDVPENSVAALSTPSASTSGFTADKEGSYLIRLTVNGMVQDVQYAAIISTHLGVRLPAAGETLQDSLIRGWALSLNRGLLSLEFDQRFASEVSAKAVGAIAAGAPVYAVSTGLLPNGDTVVTVAPASALSATTARVFGVASFAAANNEQIDINTFGPSNPIVGFDTSSSSLGAPVYLGDAAGTLSLTPGTITTVVGTVLAVFNPGIIVINPENTILGSLSNNNPTQVDAGDVAVPGVSTKASRSDHQHPVNTGAPGTIVFGDVPTPGASPALAKADHKHGFPAPADPLNVFKQTASAGTGAAAARDDHKHDVTTGTPVSVGVANAPGVLTSLVRSDHVHADNTGPQIWADVTPPTLSGNVDNYNPSPGLSTFSILRIDPGAASRDVSGLVPGFPGQLVIIQNIGLTSSLRLLSLSGLSLSANQFLLPSDLLVPVRSSATLWYDPTTAQWRSVSSSEPPRPTREVNNTDAFLTLNDYYIGFTGLTTEASATLLAGAIPNGKEYVIKDESGAAGAFPITVQPDSGEMLDGSTGGMLIDIPFGSLSVIRRNGNWWST